MEALTVSTGNGELHIALAGRIDSANAPQIESCIRDAAAAHPGLPIVLDCGQLLYISSAGLRVILRLKKEVDDTVLTNVSPDIYQILEITGFTDLMTVIRACRALSVAGCEVIGQGSSGTVYRVDRDTIVKVYSDPEALPEIRRERELARAAFLAGVPTAISYDVVRVEDGRFGSVFELLDSSSLAELLAEGRLTLDEAAVQSVRLLKALHGTTADDSVIPSMKARALATADFLKDRLPPDQYARLRSLIGAVPDDAHLLHGDFHIRNIMMQNGEPLLIDMDSLSHGHPVFELAGMYNTYRGRSIIDHTVVQRFTGLTYEDAGRFWRRSLELYLGTEDPHRIAQAEDKAKLLGFARLLRATLRRGGLSTEAGRQMIRRLEEELAGLLDRVGTLTIEQG